MLSHAQFCLTDKKTVKPNFLIDNYVVNFRAWKQWLAKMLNFFLSHLIRFQFRVTYFQFEMLIPNEKCDAYSKHCNFGTEIFFWNWMKTFWNWFSGLVSGTWGPVPTSPGTTPSLTLTWWRVCTTRPWSSPQSWPSRTPCSKKIQKFWQEMIGDHKRIADLKYTMNGSFF